MDKAYIAAIIAKLEDVRQRPLMWIGQFENIVPFINGFNTACLSTIYNIRDNFYEEVANERGWHVSAQGPESFMREKGLTESQIVDELLTIHIELWKRRYNYIESLQK